MLPILIKNIWTGALHVRCIGNWTEGWLVPMCLWLHTIAVGWWQWQHALWGATKKLCSNCKQEVWHKTDDYFELAKNAAWGPSWCTTRLWLCWLTSSVVEHTIKKNLSANKLVVLPTPVAWIPHPKQYNTHDTGVVDSGDSNIYFGKEAPIQQFNVDAPKLHVATATVQLQWYVITGTLELTNLPSNFLCTGHVMPLFKYFFIGIGSICDADCKVFPTKSQLWSTIHTTTHHHRIVITHRSKTMAHILTPGSYKYAYTTY